MSSSLTTITILVTVIHVAAFVVMIWSVDLAHYPALCAAH